VTLSIALLRAVNVAGQRAVAMADLRAALEKEGFQDVGTLLQSGNVVFRVDGRGGPELERRLEQTLEKSLGVRTEIFVRTAPEWAALVRNNPFREEAERDPGHLIAMVLRSSPAPESVGVLRSAIRGRERVELRGREAYFVYPDGVGTSRLTIKVIEGKLGTRGTARNWNTVRKLATLVGV
jgi:uncharacterized protein (DUF1697 family)